MTDSPPVPAAGEGPVDGLDIDSDGTSMQHAEPANEATPKGIAELAAMQTVLNDLVSQSRHYHSRSEQRERLIDRMHTELQQLRHGERREDLRPVLTALGRLRNDMLQEAGRLPADYTAVQAGELLRSYAASVSVILEENGVVSYTPDVDDVFEPRRHRKIDAVPNENPARIKRVAQVRHDGYLDLAADAPLALAAVDLFALPTSSPVTEGNE